MSLALESDFLRGVPALEPALRDLPVLLAFFDAHGRFRFVNARYAAVLGRSPESVIGRHGSEVLGAERFERSWAGVQPALRGEAVTLWTEGDFPGIGRRHGRMTWIPHRDAAGVVDGVVCCGEDVTMVVAAEVERRRIAAERDAALRELEAVLTLLPAGVVIAGPEGARANAEMARMLGLAPPDAPGALHPLDAAALSALRVVRDGRLVPLRELPPERARRTGEPEPLEALAVHRADGRVVEVTGAAAPLRDAEGAVVGSVACYTDVTAIRWEQEEVRRRESFLRLLADAVPGFIWALGADRALLYTSSSLDAYLGGEGALAPRLVAGLHPDDAASAVPRLCALLDAGAAFEIELRLRRRDGAFRCFLHRALPERDAAGAIVRWVGLSLDVTERLEAEATLRRAEQLQAVGTLAGGVAHEVHNQMSIVLGFGELALRKLRAGEAARDVSRMVAAGQRAADVSQQLLAFSRRQVLAPTVLDLHEVLVAFEPVLTRLLGADKRLALALAPRAVHVVADRPRLEQVLVNLTANARDAMPGGGLLTLGTRPPADDGHAVLFVRDTGVGMTEDVKARALEPFFTTKPLGAGTGLGLPTVYGIVTQSGGRLEIESAPGEGTTILVRLPSAPSAGHEADEASPVAIPPRSGVVVLAEDEPGLRELLCEVLAEAGFEVVAAADGAAALSAALALPAAPRLLLTDVVLPGMSGRVLAERVRARWPVPVLYTSGYAGEDALRGAHLDEGSAFLQKPFTPSDLLAAADRLLGRG